MVLNEKNQTLIALASTMLLGIAVLFLQNRGFESIFFQIFLRIVIPLFTIYYGYKAIKFFGLTSVQGKSIIFMTSAFFVSWIANFFWINNLDPIANMLYLIMRPFFGFGIFYSIILLDKDFFKGKKILSLLIFMIVLGGLYFSAFFDINTLISDFKNSPITQLFIFLDFFLLAFAFLTVYFIYLSFRGVYSQSWVLFGIGTLCFWLSEMYYFTNPFSYSHYGLIEFGWAAGFISFALGFALLRINAFNVIEETKIMLARKNNPIKDKTARDNK